MSKTDPNRRVLPNASSAHDSIMTFLAGATRHVRTMWACWHPKYAIAYRIAHCFPMFSAATITARLYRLAGFSIGEGSAIAGPLRVLSSLGFYENLRIGRGAVLSYDVTIVVDDLVTIGDRASIGPFVRIYTGSHSVGPGSRRMSPMAIGKPVTIGDGAWIGVGVTVLPGVTIGEGCVVGAGSVVSADIEPHTYAEGNPAVVIRDLPWRNR